MTVEKELLFKPRLPEADVDVAGLGTVRVRALSRAEAFTVQKLDQVDLVERRMLALGMVAPRLTEGEAREWQEASAAGEIDAVTNKIAELSGMDTGAAKATYKEFDADPASEFRAFPGREVGDDSGTAPGGDVSE